MIDTSKDMIVVNISDPGKFIEKDTMNFNQYINDFLNLCSRELGILEEILNMAFEGNFAISFWRLYSQTGPWADMLKDLTH